MPSSLRAFPVSSIFPISRRGILASLSLSPSEFPSALPPSTHLPALNVAMTFHSGRSSRLPLPFPAPASLTLSIYFSPVVLSFSSDASSFRQARIWTAVLNLPHRQNRHFWPGEPQRRFAASKTIERHCFSPFEIFFLLISLSLSLDISISQSIYQSSVPREIGINPAD